MLADRLRLNQLGPSDPNWANVVFLSHFDGPDASTVFVEQKGRTITRTGAIELDTANKKFGSASALGAGGYLTCASSADFDGFGAADLWTAEGFCYVPSGPAGWTYGLLSITQVAAGLHAGIHIQESGGLHYIYVYRQGEVNGYFGTITFPRGAFNYFKIVNTGSGSPVCYLNGTAVTLSSFAYGSRARPPSAGLVVGAITSAGGALSLTFIGHLDEFRLTKGGARTSSYATPTSPFPSR